MNDARHLLLHPRGAVERDRHELRRVLRSLQTFEAPPSLFMEHGRGEGHELGPLEVLVQPIVHARIGRLVKHRAIAQGPGSVLQPSGRPGDDVALGEQVGDPLFERSIQILR